MFKGIVKKFFTININMRCIEMVKHKKAVEHYLD